jgi:ribose/xylose/arabinose/galactoside ABC-type transport system permease subunit
MVQKTDAAGFVKLSKSGSWFREYSIWIILVALFILATLVSSGSFIRPSNLINVLFMGAPIGICAIGETFVILTAGIDLSVASIWILAGVVGGSLAKAGFSPILALVIALIVSLIIGAINGWIIAYLDVSPLIATLGTLTAVEGISRILTGNMPVMSLPSRYRFVGGWSIGPISIQTVLWILFVIVAVLLINKTVLGRTIFALGGNPIAAKYSGLSVGKGLFAVYCISGLLAGLAGILNSAYLNIATPNVDMNALFDVIAGCVVGGVSLFGGKGNIINTVAGVLVIVAIENLLSILGISPLIFQGVIGVVIVLAVLLNVVFSKDNGSERLRTKGV